MRFNSTIFKISVVVFLLSVSLAFPAAKGKKKKAAGKAGARPAVRVPNQQMRIANMVHGSAPVTEAQMIKVLESGATPQEKDTACACLKVIGTAKAVPALAALLPDADLSHSARLALEVIPGPEASRALIGALAKTSGLTRAGIIDSLGQRHEAEAVDAIAKCLADSDDNVAGAAAFALGKIGAQIATGPAVQALQGAYPGARAARRAAILDALLMIANERLASHDSVVAFTLFDWFAKLNHQLPDYIRQATARGLILREADDRALALVIADLQSGDGPSQMAALQLIPGLKDPDATTRVCEQIFNAKLPPAMHVALIEALRQRGDVAAVPSIVAASTNPDPNIRLAALGALGDLGDAAAVERLAEAAASTDAAEKKVARQALVDLRRGNVIDALVGQLANGSPAVQAEVARALDTRVEHSAVPKLMMLARNAKDATRTLVMQAIGQLADTSHITTLTLLLTQAQTPAARAEACQAMEAVCRRLQERRQRPNMEPILAALAGGPVETRAGLLMGVSPLVEPRLRAALRAALADSDPLVRTAAAQALNNTNDPELLPELLARANTAGKEVERGETIRSYLRLAASKESVSLASAKRIEAYKQILPLLKKPEEKWAALSGLAAIADPKALDLALPMLSDPAAKAEAAQAVLQITAVLQTTRPDLALAALQKIQAAASSDPTLLEATQAGLQKMEALSGFITAWRVAGPYQEKGMEAQALFDKVFPPEEADAKGVAWKWLPSGTLPQKPYVLDLLKPLGGNSRVAYAKARVFAPVAQPARLELGYDDGIKAWFNGKVICANNRLGALHAGDEKSEIQLQKGWNTFQLKITQNNQMWEFCARIVKPDGSPLAGLRVETPAGEMPLLAVKATPVVRVSAPVKDTPVKFKRIQIDPKFRSEGVAVADFNNDGKLDIATGTMLYLGPDWKPVPMLGEPKEYQPEKYSQEFYCFPEDIDHDGWLDLIVVGFPGQKTRWLRNPGKVGGPWKEYVAIEKTGNESPEWIDLFKDGKKELVFITTRGMGWARPGDDPTKPWPIYVIAGMTDPRPAHGLGVGDINGDGRLDILCPEGWWEAPADPSQIPWTFHKVKLGFEAPAQMCVYDVNGDGRADVISSGAHKYGLWWYEQMADGSWTPHVIDMSISQMHALHLADINGDGLLDIVSGKRFWAHTHNDDGIDDPAILTWFELQRQGGKVNWIRHDIDNNSGVGLHFRILDINGDGKLDIVTSHKKGVYLFEQTTASAKK